MRKHLLQLEKNTTFWILVGFSCLFFFLRLPSLFEPYWYGDEGIYQTIGFALQEGRTLYTDIWDNKTPLLYLFYAFFGPEQMTMRALSLVVGVASISIFYLLSSRLYRNKYPALVATGIYTVLFGLPFLEGNIANAENFLLLPILLGVLLFLSAVGKDQQSPHKLKLFTLSGVSLGVAFLIKTVAAFDAIALLLFFLITTLPKKLTHNSLRQYLNKYRAMLLVFIGGFLLPFLISLMYFLFFGSLTAYISAAFFGNLDYIGVENTLMLLFGKLLVIGLGLLLIFQNRTRLSSEVIFICVWFALSLFNSFFTQRPYTHYLLVLLPSFCLLTGLLFTPIKRKSVIAVTLILTTIGTLIFFNNWSIVKSLTYYSNFISYITKSQTFVEYASFFDSRAPRDHDIAAYLRNELTPDDTAFFWGDNAQMYYLTQKLPPGRYTVAYHITNTSHALEETREAFLQSQPDYIVIFPDTTPFPYPMYNYEIKLNIQGVNLYEKIY